jgi:tRNA(fMet)-specific endonuclease VapC
MMVLDSDHWIELLRGRLDVRHYVAADDVLGITSISVGELVYGAQRSMHVERNLARIELLLAGVVVLPYDEIPARRFGQLKAELERQGTPLADLDLQIAATCLAVEATLVTHNGRHFGRVKDLKLEDWLI